VSQLLAGRIDELDIGGAGRDRERAATNPDDAGKA